MGCDLYQLKAFFILAKTMNFTKAARMLYVTQPAVSHALKKLEESLDTKLVAKRGNRLVLTENGRLLYDACEDIFYRLDKAEESIRANREDFYGDLRLGATVEFGTTVLIRHMRKFLDANSNVHVDFTFHDDLLPHLLNDELDVIIDCRDLYLDQLDKIHLFREEYVVVGTPEYIRRHGVSRPRDLEKCLAISFDKNGQWWDKFIQALPEAERPGHCRWTEMNHLRAMINAACAGIGLAMVPKYCVAGQMKRRILVNVFPDVALLEDQFWLYQKKKKSGLRKHLLVVDFLKSMRPEEFGG